MPDSATLRILTEEPYGTISPRLYGHFAEHLGRCCYGGLWVGESCTDHEHVDGFRRDVADALREMPTPMLRWPGGCYADHYHWRDGIGPKDGRPVRLGLSCGLTVEDDNSLGTHEFLRFCELIGAEPYLAGNMGSGSVQEMCDWVEYLNASVATTLVKERRANGRAEPYGVRLWGVGNENWGCGGDYEAGSYALEYRRYASMLRGVDPSLELVACGFDSPWNRVVMEKLKDHLRLIDHLSIHKYWIEGGPQTGFTEADYYRLLAEAESTETFVRETREIIEEATGGRKFVGIALDEWGVWHPEARPWGPGAAEDTPHGGCLEDYSQAGTMRDAVAAAIGLETFHRQCASLSLCNLAQVVNVLHAPVMTEGASMWVTPTYHVLRLHAPHVGAEALRVAIEGGASLPDGTPAVSATASRKEGRTAVTLTNRHFSQGITVRIDGASTAKVLAAESPDAQNGPDAPSRVAPREVTVQGGVLELPPCSVATLALTPSFQ